MSSSRLRKSAKGASPEYGQQVPGIGKDFLRGGRDIFQAQDASIHLVHPQPYTSSGEKQVVMGDESPGLVKFTLTSGVCAGGEVTPDSPTSEGWPAPGIPLPGGIRDCWALTEHFVVGVIALCCLKTAKAWP